MDPSPRYVIPLAQASDLEEHSIGGKAAKLARLAQAGVRVPDGFSITSLAYERFLQAGGLVRVIQMELGRKPLSQMRWEEIWDAALRLRSAFLNTPIPVDLTDDIRSALRQLGVNRAVAVRSSAPGEDSAQRSFVGLHESYLNVVGEEAVLDAVRLVWASLWSDGALLYRRELSLDPVRSRMAVLVQAMIDEDRSGVAFGRDPRDLHLDRAIVEAVPGPCSDLVDGLVDPDRWILQRSSGAVLEWRPGERESGKLYAAGDPSTPLLDQEDLLALYRALTRVESFFGWPPDIEWTGQAGRLTLLQARPITTASAEPGDEKSWYLSLRPGMQRLKALRERVAGELIPQLEALGRRLADEAIEPYDDRQLAHSIQARWAAVQEWKKTYWDEFIPFAHGVRQLATYYNDAVRPTDPYEFVGLLRGQQMLAAQRNRMIEDLACRLQDNESLRVAVLDIAGAAANRTQWQQALSRLRSIPGGEAFVGALETLQASLLDVAYDEERLAERPDLLLHAIAERTWATECSRAPGPSPQQGIRSPNGASEQPRVPDVEELERRLWDAVGAERRREAEEVLAIARLSWRLRDDDNVLLGRVESQLLRAVHLGAARLLAAGRLSSTDRADSASALILAEALLARSGGPVDLPVQAEPSAEAQPADSDESPRQLVGQPAAPGMATGTARCIRGVEDLGRFEAGEVLVCDAIQPTMTHLVPLASAVVERRGGMLIHGAIIARELGIPCVNGIPHAVEVLHDGELLTVDGYLGIVTVGAPEFELEGVR